MKRVGKKITLLASAAALGLGGCAGETVVPLNADAPRGIGVIGLAPIEKPVLRVSVGAEGRSAMADPNTGGGVTAAPGPTGAPVADGVTSMGSVFPNDPVFDAIGGGIVIFLAPMLLVEALGGMSDGGPSPAVPGEEMPPEMLRGLSAPLRKAVADFRVSETMRDRMFAELSDKTAFGLRLHGDAQNEPDDGSEATGRADTIFEIDDPLIALVPQGRGFPSLLISAEIRLLRAESDEEIYATDLALISDEHPFRDWVSNDAALFRTALDDLTDAFTRYAVRTVFLTHPNPKSAQYPRSDMAFYPIQPEYPDYGTPVTSSTLDKPPYLDSLQPTLRWRAFPSREDIAFDFTGQLERATNVTYDLKISYGKPENDIEGLTRPSFTLIEPLVPGSSFSWTVRARFEVDGFSRLTNWMVLKNYDSYWAGDCGDPYESTRDDGEIEYSPKGECLAGLQTHPDPWQRASLIRSIQPADAEYRQTSTSTGSKPTTDTLSPTLRWQAFPNSYGPAGDPYGRLGRVTNVTYDLRIWSRRDVTFRNTLVGLESELAFQNIDGLSETSFVLPEPLEPDTLYFWTVRANFEIDGKPETGGWMPKQVCADKFRWDIPNTSCLANFWTPGK